MADVAAPSVADIGVTDKKKPAANVKPEQPDEKAYEAALKKAEKEHADSQTKFNAIKAKVDNAQGSKNTDTPEAKKKAELLAELKKIREQQAGGKASRGKIFDEIKKTDDKLKSQIAESKAARGKSTFKNVGEIDSEIAALQKQVDSGSMKIVDDKKALSTISQLTKEKKQFKGLDEAQKQIEEIKKKLAALRSTLDDPESKALSEKYNKLQAELDVIKAEQDDAYKNISALRAERDKLYNDQQEKWKAIKKVKDDHWAAKRAFQEYEYQARQRTRERKKQENAEFDKKKKLERATKVLEEAGEKAYLDDIRRAENLLRWCDPSYSKENVPLKAPSQFTASAQRTVDDSGIKGMKVVKKEEEDYFKGSGGKKGKKGKKAPEATAASPSKFNCPPQIMDDCSSMGIDPPMSAADIESVREKVKAKLEFWKSDQDAQTARNIAKAKKEVERLDAEDSAPATPVETSNGHGHGETKATAAVDEGGSVANEIALEEAAVKDVAADLKEASIEDKE